MTNANKIALVILGVLLILGFGCVFFGNNNPPSNQTNNTSLCPTQVSPVCGNDGRNYNNECLARRAGTSVAYSGTCRIETCSETDNGRDILVKGTTTKGTSGKTDSCVGTGSVLEYYCSDNAITNSTVACPAGMNCQDGSCKVVQNTTLTPCNDTDNGLSYFVSGSVSQNGTTYNDECSGANSVREYSCRNGSVTSTSYDCPTNYVCSTGRCVERNTCTDTDSDNPNVAGSVNTTSSSGNRITLEDYCAGGSTVVEYTCSNGSSISNRITCTGGRVCRDGACRADICEDSDGGRDYYTRGTASRGSSDSEDRCISTSGLVEYYCRDGNIQSETYSCPSGYSCTNGRCTSTGGSSSCTDTDGGTNYAVRGVVRTADGSSGTDTCSGTRLVEYYCDGNTRRSAEYTPLSSERCVDGAIVSSTPTSDCSDPDGRSTTTATSVTHSGEAPGVDSCFDSTTVVEFYCNSAGNIQADPIGCSSGMMCDAGRCVSGLTYTCSDPDGIDLTTQTTAVERDSTGVENSATDGCDGTTAVWEARCISTRIEITRYECPAGTSCTSGACTGSAVSCSETDGGRDYISGGITRVSSGGSGTDSCSGDTLIEYFCDGSSMAHENHPCGIGYECANSASGAYCKAICTDNDAWVGADPIVQSTSRSYATYADTTYYDICIDSTRMYEQTCSGRTSAPTQNEVDCSSLGLSCYGSPVDGGAYCST